MNANWYSSWFSQVLEWSQFWKASIRMQASCVHIIELQLQSLFSFHSLPSFQKSHLLTDQIFSLLWNHSYKYGTRLLKASWLVIKETFHELNDGKNVHIYCCSKFSLLSALEYKTSKWSNNSEKYLRNDIPILKRSSIDSSLMHMCLIGVCACVHKWNDFLFNANPFTNFSSCLHLSVYRNILSNYLFHIKNYVHHVSKVTILKNWCMLLYYMVIPNSSFIRYFIIS